MAEKQLIKLMLAAYYIGQIDESEGRIRESTELESLLAKLITDNPLKES